MPSTPERPPGGAGPPADQADGTAVGDATPLADRPTVPVDVSRRAPATEDDLVHRETVRLPTQRGTAARRAPGRAPLPVAAAFATAWAALLSYLPVAIVMALAQLVESAGSLAGAARTGLAAWLLGHGVPLDTAIGPVGLAPLALTVLAAWRLVRAGVHVTRAIGARGRGSTRDALTAATAVGLGYGLLGALAALLVDAPGLSVAPLRAGLTLAFFGTAAAWFGALRSTGAFTVLAVRTPTVLRHGLRTGVAAGCLLLAAGAGFAGLSVAIGGSEAGELIRAYRTGVAGQAGITLVSLAFAPNAAAWAAAYLLGPGFAVGTGTAVRLTEVDVGPLPAVPLFAGLPTGPVGGFGAALLVVPVLAGALAGWLLARRMAREADLSAVERAGIRWPVLLGAAATAGPVAGVLLGALAIASGGPAGDGRLAQIGPVAWQVAAIAMGVIAGGAVLGAAATRAFGTNRR